MEPGAFDPRFRVEDPAQHAGHDRHASIVDRIDPADPEPVPELDLDQTRGA
jgi:hypothetical protein